MAVAALLLFPLLASPLVWWLRRPLLNRLAIWGQALLAIAAALDAITGGPGFTPYFCPDPLNALFLLAMAVIYAGVAANASGHIRDAGATPRRQAGFTVCLMLFVFAMSGAILSTHLGLFWVFIELTTLASAPLILADGSRHSLEAAWKYIFICSIGILLAFVGILLLAVGAGELQTLFFSDLTGMAGRMDPFWLKLAFPFVLVGFGTKMGLAPLHAWLPDAHAEAPSPVSALLSGALLNTAFLGILRLLPLLGPAGLLGFGRGLLLVTGFLSLLVSAVYVVRMRNYKRLLAYSSIEHMGVMAIGMGLGGIGVVASLLHMLAHSLGKATLFLCSGNAYRIFRQKTVPPEGGLLKADPATGWLWIGGFLALAAIPPSPAFISEFWIVSAMFGGGRAPLAVLFLGLLTVIVWGMGRTVFSTSFGRGPAGLEPQYSGLGAWLPQAVFLLLLTLLGVVFPPFIFRLLEAAARIVGGGIA
jgi:hydrogenase-4 component F